MRKCRSIILPWNVSEHIRKQKRKQNKANRHSRTSTPDLRPPPSNLPQTRLLILFGMTGSVPEMSLAKVPLPIAPSVRACLPRERNARALFT